MLRRIHLPILVQKVHGLSSGLLASLLVVVAQLVTAVGKALVAGQFVVGVDAVELV